MREGDARCASRAQHITYGDAMTTYLVNAFSHNMNDWSRFQIFNTTARVLRHDEARSIALDDDTVVGIGYENTARVVANDLRIERNLYARHTLNAQLGDRFIVAQYTGDRLAPAATELPPGATLRYILVEVVAQGITGDA